MAGAKFWTSLNSVGAIVLFTVEACQVNCYFLRRFFAKSVIARFLRFTLHTPTTTTFYSDSMHSVSIALCGDGTIG